MVVCWTAHHDYYFVFYFLIYSELCVLYKKRKKKSDPRYRTKNFLYVRRDVLGMGIYGSRYNVWYYVYYRREWLLKWIIMVHAVTPTSKINLLLWFRAWKQYEKKEKKTYQLRLYCYLKICIPSFAWWNNNIEWN